VSSYKNLLTYNGHKQIETDRLNIFCKQIETDRLNIFCKQIETDRLNIFCKQTNETLKTT